MKSSGLTERQFAEMVAQQGGRAVRAGSCVRDSVLGLQPREVEFCIEGMVKKNFAQLFLEAEALEKPFPLFHLNIDGIRRTVAFARKEQLTENGWRISAKPKVTLAEDLFRRDVTVNALAMDCLTGEIIDPWQGLADIKKKVLRANGPHFSRNPLNGLRLMSQAAYLGFSIDDKTISLARETLGGILNLPPARIAAELVMVFKDTPSPGRFFSALAEAGLLEAVCANMAELAAEDFQRGIVGLNAVAQTEVSPKVRFAALGTMLSVAEVTGWLENFELPGGWAEAAIATAKIIKLLQQPVPEKIVDTITALRRGPLTLEEFDRIVTMAAVPVVPLGPLKECLTLPPGVTVPAELMGKEIGQWLRKHYVTAITQKLKSS